MKSFRCCHCLVVRKGLPTPSSNQRSLLCPAESLYTALPVIRSYLLQMSLVKGKIEKDRGMISIDRQGNVLHKPTNEAPRGILYSIHRIPNVLF